MNKARAIWILAFLVQVFSSVQSHPLDDQENIIDLEDETTQNVTENGVLPKQESVFHLEDVQQLANGGVLNLTEAMAERFDSSIKKVIDVLDKVLVNITRKTLGSVMDGALYDCVEPLTDTVKTLALGLNDALQNCIGTEISRVSEMRSQIVELLSSLQRILQSIDSKMEVCKTDDDKCTELIANLIANQGFSLSQSVASFLKQSNFVLRKFNDRFQTCIETKIEAVLYKSSMILIEVFSCANYEPKDY